MQLYVLIAAITLNAKNIKQFYVPTEHNASYMVHGLSNMK